MKKVGCIIVDVDKIYGARFHADKGSAIMEKIYSLNREGELFDELENVFQVLDDGTTEFGIVSTETVTTHLLPMEDKGNRIELAEFVSSEQYNRILGKHRKDVQDFIIRTIGKREYLYMVSMPVSVISDLSSALHKKQSKFSVIDYWPHPLQGNHQKTESALISIIETSEGIKGYLWWHELLLAQATLGDKESASDFLARLQSLDVENRMSNPSVYLSVTHNKEDWKAVLSNYRQIQLKPIALDSSLFEGVVDDVFTQALVGMAYQLLGIY